MSQSAMGNAPNPQPSYENVLQALKTWRSGDLVASPFAGLLLFRKAQTDLPDITSAHNHVLSKALEELGRTDRTRARLLELRFARNLTGREAALELHVAESTLFRLQREAVAQLASVIAHQEARMRASCRTNWRQRLEPSTYSHLIGVDSYLTVLADVLNAPDSPDLVAVEGIGGIGKTALADALTRMAIEQLSFADLSWVTARQQSLNLGGSIRSFPHPGVSVDHVVEMVLSQLCGDEPLPVALSDRGMLAMLHGRLKQAPHLVVIDNLETISDVENLLPTLHQLAGPSKFLLTSRESLYEEPGVHHIVLRELKEADALALIRQEARERNLPHVAEADDQELKPVFATVGGNPLALRLVVGQLHAHALGWVLQDLDQARGQSVANLYHYIYRRAWDHLDEDARHVLLAMPLVMKRGGDMAHIVEVSGLPPGNVSDALNRLVKLNLVDSIGDLSQRRYTIHSLTRTFLHEITRWM